MSDINSLDDLLAEDTKPKKKLLVVDDKQEILDNIKLGRLGQEYEIITANSAQEGLKILQEDQDIGVVLLDMLMPQMSGSDFMEEVRSGRTGINPKTKILIHTAYAGEGVNEADVLMNYRPDGFLRKDKDLAVIHASVANCYKSFDRDMGKLLGHIVLLNPRQEFIDRAKKTKGYETHVFTDQKEMFAGVETIINSGDKIAYVGSDLSTQEDEVADIYIRLKNAFPSIKSFGAFREGTNDEEILLENEINEGVEWLQRREHSPKLITTLKGKKILVDGVTGFLGPYIVRGLLEQEPDAEIYVIGRGSREKTIDMRLEDVGLGDERIIPIEGDVTKPNLGLTHEDFQKLAGIEEIWHIAGSTSFDEKDYKNSFEVNVLGTNHLLSMVADMPSLKCFNHISTAYVAGKTHFPEIVYENLKLPVNGFRIPYESSKAMAELAVAHSGLPYRIFRPSIIVGDLKTGFADDKVIYGVALALYKVKKMMERRGIEEGIRILAEPNVQKNLVSIDYTSEAILGVRQNDVGLGKIYHITNPIGTRQQDMFGVLAQVIGLGKGVKLVNPLDPKTMHMGEKLLAKGLRGYEGYMTISDANFSRVNTDRDSGVVCPEIGTPQVKFLFEIFFAKYKE